MVTCDMVGLGLVGVLLCWCGLFSTLDTGAESLSAAASRHVLNGKLPFRTGRS